MMQKVVHSGSQSPWGNSIFRLVITAVFAEINRFSREGMQFRLSSAESRRLQWHIDINPCNGISELVCLCQVTKVYMCVYHHGESLDRAIYCQPSSL